VQEFLMANVRIALAALLMASTPSEVVAHASTGDRGESVSPISHQLFDKGDGYLWTLMHDAQNDGYQCSVSFITPKGTYSIHGPLDSEMAKTNSGTLWFDSPAVPATAGPQKVTLAVHGNDGAFNWPAVQTTIGKTSHGTLMVAVQIFSVLKEKADTNDISISLGGNEVFKAKLVGLQAAYAKLNDCMAARPGN
jgi:hypothetical protein